MSVPNPKPDGLERPPAPSTAQPKPGEGARTLVLVVGVQGAQSRLPPDLIALDPTGDLSPERIVGEFSRLWAGRTHAPATTGRLAAALHALGHNPERTRRLVEVLLEEARSGASHPRSGFHEGLLVSFHLLEPIP